MELRGALTHCQSRVRDGRGALLGRNAGACIETHQNKGSFMNRFRSIMLGTLTSFTLGLILPLAGESVVHASESARICTQNLARVGKAPFGRKRETSREQSAALVRRIQEAQCDVVAVQEVYGKSKAEALENLDRFAREVSTKVESEFVVVVGEAEFDEIRNGFLVRRNFARIKQILSPQWTTLPKLSALHQTRRQTRLPIALELDVAGTEKDLLVVSFHFKSKTGGFKDPTRTDFETLRMQQAEQLFQFAVAHSTPNGTTLLLGDRNSRPGSATDRILEGGLRLQDFSSGCALTRELEPTCSPRYPSRFLPLFAEERNGGSTRFRGEEELIDAIYLEVGAPVKKARDIGMTGEFNRGSDHKLLWVELPL